MDSPMDFPTSSTEDHSRTIVHIDLDCFYAQVEMIKNPELRTQPLGIQQKNIVVTCNYVAREFGIKKCMQVKDAQQLCPKLVLVKGEDLHDYRQMSVKVSELLQKYSPLVERLGLDENYIDVSRLVHDRLQKDSPAELFGNSFIGEKGNDNSFPCYCGCKDRLTVGTEIADEMRNVLRDELGLTSCAGIAYNKLLAKLVGGTHKPNQQTVLFHEYVDNLLIGLENVRCITGIGYKTAETLSSLGITKVSEVREYSLEKLRTALGSEMATRIYDLCHGKDNSLVKPSGKPNSIGIEDSCKSLSVMTEVQNKFKVLLVRLMELVSEDGRIPSTIKVTVRKYDDARKCSRREQKQCNIPASLFSINNGIKLSDASRDKLIAIIMKLFYRLVDVSKTFHVTLLGVSFTKFQERASGYSSIASFFMSNVSVQSITNLRGESGEGTSDEKMSFTPRRCSLEFNTDGSESEVEPSPKKTKSTNVVAGRRCLASPTDGTSPSKLSVAALRLNSRDASDLPSFNCPSGMDDSVFRELPPEVQKEVIEDWHKREGQVQTTNKKTVGKNNGIMKYLIKN